MSLKTPSPLDEAQMRQEFRRLYREIGDGGCIHVLYEMIVAARWLSETILQERGAMDGCGCTASRPCEFHASKLRGSL